MAALMVRATAPLVLEDRLCPDTRKFPIWLSMYMYPLEPTFLMTMNQSTGAPAADRNQPYVHGMGEGGAEGGGGVGGGGKMISHLPVY